jgi:MOSC domain-containing protein YiiM
MASIYSIVYQPKDQVYGERPDEYIRVPIQRASLIVGHGIEGDQKAGHQPDRQLNLLSQEWLMALQPKGYKIGPGQFGEQIIISGIAVESLEPGVRLQLGQEAWIEVTKSRTGCDRLELAQGQTIKGLGPMGVMAKVIIGGAIAVGDPVTILETAPRVAVAYPIQV